MSRARRVAVVIVNYRTPGLTCDAVASLAGEIDPARDAAVVVDNASGDGSAQRIGAWLAERGFAWAQLLAAPGNGGFAAGNNLGIARVEADFYLLLNSDAQLRPGALAALLAAAHAHPGAGLLGPRIEAADGAAQASVFRDPTPLSELIHAAATGPVTRLLRRWDVPVANDEARPPDWLSFACVLIRREVLDAAGPLDEGYFLYYEDVDFCRRARRAGWEHAFVPDARALHLHGASTQLPASLADRARAPAYLYDARARYFTKFYGRSGLWLANVAWTLGRLVSLARERIGHKAPHVAASEWRDIWRGRPGL